MSYQPSYSFTIRVGLCILVFYLFAQRFIDQQNALYQLRKRVPQLEKELIEIQEQVEEKEYELQKYSSPAFLLKQMDRDEFSHLEFPQEERFILVEEWKSEKE